MNNNTTTPVEIAGGADGRDVTAEMIDLARVWQNVLGREKVGLDDDFFASGGDSLLALQVVETAAARGLSIKLIDLYARPTIRQLLSEDSPERPTGENTGARPLISEADRSLLPDGTLTAYPATSLQLGLIYESEVVDRSLYHDVITRRIEGTFDEDLLREAIGLVVSRHEALRTGIDLTGYSIPLQVVRREVTVPVEIMPAATIEVAVARASRPFDLEDAPLLRFVVSAVDGDGFRLTVAFHHIIMDGWSESRFTWELLTAYDALLTGRRPYLGPMPAGIAEFVGLERQAIESAETVAFWKRHTRPAAVSSAVIARSRHSNRISVPVPLEIGGDDLERAGRRYRASAKTVLAAAHLRALARLRDTDHPTTGMAVNGRPEAPGADVMIGLFLNIVPFGVPVDRPDADLVAAVQRFEATLLPHRRYPIAEIVRRAGGPLFDTVFNYVRFHLHGKLRHLTAIAVGPADVRDKTSVPLDFDLIHDPGSGRIDLVLVADPALFDEATLEVHGQVFRRCLDRLLGHGSGRGGGSG